MTDYSKVLAALRNWVATEVEAQATYSDRYGAPS
jgi:hypothetical protein